MKTATITLSVTEGVPMPNSDLAAQAGFRLTLERVSTEGQLVLPVENKLTWVIGDFIEGELYTLLVEAVDANGNAISALPLAEIQVPAVATYTRPDGFMLAWD